MLPLLLRREILMAKRICSKCRSEATLNEKGEYSAITFRCPVCFRGQCRHYRTYKAADQYVCGECMVVHLDQRAIKRAG